MNEFATTEDVEKGAEEMTQEAAQGVSEETPVEESAPQVEDTGDAEMTSTETVEVPKDGDKVQVETGSFAPLENEDAVYTAPRSIDMLMDLELPVAVELGRVGMVIKDILELGPGAVIELNKFSGEPVDIFLNKKKFAEGEVVVIDQNFGVRITALVGPTERLSNLNN